MYGSGLRRDDRDERTQPPLPLLERRHEQAVLTSVLAGLRGGSAAVVSVTGAPGHGQNALLRWAARLARDSGLRVLRARGALSERDVPHGVTAQFKTSLDGPARGPLRTPTGGRRPDGPAGFDTFDTLSHQARAVPILLVVEDAQWLDPASTVWLRTLARRLTPDTPVAVMASGGGTAADGQDWFGTAAPGPVAPRRLVPRALSGRGVAAAVELLCGVPGEERFTAAATTATGGSPVLLGEVLRRFTGHGHEPVAARLPELHTICADVAGEHVTRVLDGLPAPATALLRAVAVCGDLVNSALVQELAVPRPAPGDLPPGDLPSGSPAPGSPAPGSPAPGVEPGAVLEASGLTVFEDTKLRLRLPAVKDRVLEDLPPGERARLHARAAELAHRASAADEDVARLLLMSPPLGSPWVVPLLRRTFAAALRGQDHGRAHACLSRALREPLEPDERARLTLELAAAEAVALPEAGDRRLAGLARPGGPVPAALRVRAVDVGLARGNSDWTRRAAAEALSGTRDGEQDVERNGERNGEGDAQRDGMLALFWLADQARDGTEVTVPEVAPLPDRPVSPAQAGVRAWQLAARGEDLETTRTLARTALARGGSDAGLTLPRLAACGALILTDDCEEAGIELDVLLTEVRRAPHLRAVAARVLTLRAELGLRCGQLDEAERDVEAAVQALPPSSWYPLAAPGLTALRVSVALESGCYDRARSIAAVPPPPGAEDGVSWSALLFARARLAAADGQWSEAMELSRESGRRLLRRQWSNPALLGWRPLAAEACHTLGDRTEAARLSREEVALARRWGTASAVGVAALWAGPMTGEGGRPVARARAATRLLRDSPARLAYAWGLFQLAAAELEEGDRQAAARTAAELSAFTAACPSSRLADCARRLTERLRAPGRPVPAALPREWTTLSEVERHTATFAGNGHGNREIAELLSVSRRTVELRLSNTYRKLRIAGREELSSLVRNMEGRPTDAA
ncbi:AAA family ATPase [Streptomyces sp. NPDC051569]|uniref:AAA family ATPase n=1 Tax=Streptomyces sp. NPDC051569 TaxID=3365661 RepID=UPI0037A89521